MSVDFSAEAMGNDRKRPRPSGDASSSSGEGGAAGANAGGFSRKQSDNLDFRTRGIEACIYTTFKVKKSDAESKTPVKEMLTAKDAWEANLPKDADGKLKKEAHPWGHQRISLSAALLRCFASGANAGYIDSTLAANMGKFQQEDALAQALNCPSIQNQLTALRGYVDAKPAADHISFVFQHCQVTETKKKDHFLIKLQLNTDHPLHRVAPLLKVIFECVGGELLEGAAPKGPLFHDKKKGGKK